jgi:hypothetical protein
MMKIIIVILSLFLFCSCNTIPLKIINPNYSPSIETKKSYTLNKPLSCFVGDEILILKKQANLMRVAYKCKEDCKIETKGIIGKQPEIKKGDVFLKYAIYDNNLIVKRVNQQLVELDYNVYRNDFRNYDIGVGIRANGTIGLGYFAMITTHPYDYELLEQKNWSEDVLFDKIDYIESIKSNFVYSLKYMGTVNSIIKIEVIVSHISKPLLSSTKIIEYDMTKGNIIGYKGIKIEVTSYGNYEINYMILEDNNLDWVRFENREIENYILK